MECEKNGLWIMRTFSVKNQKCLCVKVLRLVSIGFFTRGNLNNLNLNNLTNLTNLTNLNTYFINISEDRLIN